MNNEYYSGLPRSDDIYHFGTKGQKWGVRRYQYEDGTLTPLGKIHYATSKVGSGVKRAGKAVGKSAVKGFKKRHPQYMTNDELKERTERIKLEAAYKQAVNDRNRQSLGKRIITGILERGSTKLTDGAFDIIVSKMKRDAELDYMLEKEKRDEEREIRREQRSETREINREARNDARNVRDKITEQIRNSKKVSNIERDKALAKFATGQLSDKELEDYANRIGNLRRIENENSGGGGGKSGKKKK